MDEENIKRWNEMKEKVKKVSTLLIDLDIEFDFEYWGSLEGCSIYTEKAQFDFNLEGLTSVEENTREEDNK